ncbi:MAG: alpha-L-arabinofuranosidase C-terminal domain-containing protein [Tepidisphaeraceae bacterium]
MAIVNAQTPATQPATATTAQIVIDAGKHKAISPELFGIFFEDLNYAADGGIYPELIQNRSFDYSPLDRTTWNALTSWELVQRGGGKGNVSIDASYPIHKNNTQYAVLETANAGDGVGLANDGFDGLAVTAGQAYDASLFARHLYTGRRWGSPKTEQAEAGTLVVRLESKAGEVLAEATLASPNREWSRLSATLTPTKSDDHARFVLLMKKSGGVAIDMVSLFPKATFRNRPNGLRADLAQAVADLKPKFVRFPGGCLVHGNGLGNLYRWKNTIGPVEQRKGQSNLWGYHQSVGLGFFEYFQFCEDIGAAPLPVLPAGVCCQNSEFTGGLGQRGVPLDEMAEHIQDVLDLIEYANGPATSPWGSKRAAAGHPEPFNLKYVGVGNEEHITPVFKERFKMIYEAVRAKHPEITVIGTVGPAPAGRDFDEGWKIADELKIPVVDEHYYESPAWFLKNLSRYDSYDRGRSKVYLGEYASRGNTLGNAIAEAAYMTSLERNGDVVQMASYAPLLCKLGHVQWAPDLIFFDNAGVYPSVNYYVQQLFTTHSGDTYLSSTVQLDTPLPDGQALAVSTVKDSKSGDLILKIVNASPKAVTAKVRLDGVAALQPVAQCHVLTGDPAASNPRDPRAKNAILATPAVPTESQVPVAGSFDYAAPANSLTVIRLRTK